MVAVGSLDDPTRRALYELVAAAPAPVSRDEAAARQHLPRSTATFHLERLVEVGLLRTTFAKLSGRTGPGSGRPAKLYAPAPGEIAVSVPPRHYDLAARVLASAVERSTRDGAPVAGALAAAAAEAGHELAAGATSLLDVLQRHGFQPEVTEDDQVVLGNCPFHRLVEDHPETVCTLNLHLLRGAAEATGEPGLRLALAPAPGRCCVTVAGLACPRREPPDDRTTGS
jgi:predicted ArsR family transcriptional regulator